MTTPIVDLWLDDKRPPPDGWLGVASALRAMEVLATSEVRHLSLDHDLGHCERCTGCRGYLSACGCSCHMTGYSVVLFMASTGLWPSERPKCHSRNPGGQATIEAVVNQWYGRRIVWPRGEFRLTSVEQERAQEFQRRHEAKHGRCRAAAGGRYSYTLSPTSLGTAVRISCSACHKYKDVTDYESW